MKFYRFIALLTAAILLFAALPTLHAQAASGCEKKITVTYKQSEARKMLSLINNLRKAGNAWYWNETDTAKVTPTDLQPLAYDYELEAVAMQRAAELVESFSHTRPNGESCFTAFTNDWRALGENIAAGYPSYASVFEGWSETDDPYAGQGHRRNMLSDSFTSVGIGCVEYNGYLYWTQEFSAPPTGAAYTAPADSAKTVSIPLGEEHQDADGDHRCDLCGSALLSITSQPVSQTVNAGTNATFQVAAAGEGLSYAWYYKDAGSTSYTKSASTARSVTYTTSAARNGRQIYCVVTDKYGNTVRSNTVTLTVISVGPKITTQPASKTVNAGVNATFSVTASGSGLTYAWYYKDAGNSSYTKSASTASSVTYTTSAARNGRQIYCVVSDHNGNSVRSDTVTLTVLSAGPKITTQPVSKTVTAGVNAKFGVTATGEGLTYAWYYKDAGSTSYTKSASTASSVIYTTSAARNGRQIYCVVTDKYGNSVRSNTVTLTVTPAGPRITTQPASKTVKAGTNATFSVIATGSGLTYAWYYKDAGKTSYTKSASTASSVTYTTSAARNGRQIYCVVTDKYGNTVKSNTVTLKVQ